MHRKSFNIMINFHVIYIEKLLPRFDTTPRSLSRNIMNVKKICFKLVKTAYKLEAWAV